MTGLQGIQFGNHGYATHLDELAAALCFWEQNLRRLQALRDAGVTRAPSGHDLATCIEVCTEKLAKRRADYERAKAEAL